MSTFVDFKALKETTPIADVIAWLGIKLTQAPNGQLRGECPICNKRGDRTFVVTPSKGLYNSFCGCGGGDIIKLVANYRKIGTKEAAAEIAAHFDNRRDSSPRPTAPATVPQNEKGALKPLEYLEPTNAALESLGVSEETARLFQSGYAPKGVLRGRYAVPVTSPDGTLLAYAGIAVTREQSPHLLFHNFDPTTVLFNAHAVEEKGDLWVCKDPLEAIRAVENGINPSNVVAFLSPISAQSLEMLAALLDRKGIETCDLF